MGRALITGGAGFLGSTCATLSRAGPRSDLHRQLHHRATPAQHRAPHRPRRLPLRQARRHELHPRRRPARRRAALRLARQPDRLPRAADPDAEGRLARHAQHARPRQGRRRRASSSRRPREVYGDPLVHPQKEDYWGNVNPVGPRGVYDEAKRFAEAMTMAYHRFHGVDTRIVRIFNTYGPRMRLNDGRVVPAFIAQALRGEPLTVFGDGSQTRSLLLRRRPRSTASTGSAQSDEHEPDRTSATRPR